MNQSEEKYIRDVTEIQVKEMFRLGKSFKEIAEFLYERAKSDQSS